MDSCLAAWIKPQVLTRTTSASSPSSRSVHPPAARRAASSSESTSLRAQPRVTRLTVRELDTRRGYVIARCPPSPAGGEAPAASRSADGDRGLAERVNAQRDHVDLAHLLVL